MRVILDSDEIEKKRKKEALRYKKSPHRLGATGASNFSPEWKVFKKEEKISSAQKLSTIEKKTGVRRTLVNYLIQSSITQVRRPHCHVSLLKVKERKLAPKVALTQTNDNIIIITRKALDVFEDVTIAENWVLSPNKSFRGKPPYEVCLLESGLEKVLTLLGQIEHGIIS